MRLIEHFKELIRPKEVKGRDFQQQGKDNSASQQIVDVEREDDVHYTPPGQWPTRGPKPSKLAILTYYFSLIMCVFGILVMAKSLYIPHDERPQVLMISGALIALGFVALFITNILNDREHKKFVTYLQLKVEELMSENRGKGPRALDS